MNDTLTLRSATARDFDFCQRLYFEGMADIITTLGLDEAKQRASFGTQWRMTEVQIVAVAGEEIGWLQVAAESGALFLGALYVDRRFQGRGIGTRVLRILFDEATRPCAINLAPSCDW
jgi:GNAT superfamily N-acetyltransferase